MRYKITIRMFSKIHIIVLIVCILITQNSCKKTIEPQNNEQGVLPEKLKISPDIVLDELDETSGWAVYNGTIGLNKSDLYSGKASIKLTSTSDLVPYIEKSVKWDLSSNPVQCMKIWVYPHSDPSISFSYIIIKLYTNNSTQNYFQFNISNRFLEKNEWGLLEGALTVTEGTPNWSNITCVRILGYRPKGEVFEMSLDLELSGAPIKPAVLIQFDDGHSSVYTKAFPEMKLKNMVATASVISSYVNTDPFMSSEQLLDLNDNGWDIANHTATHPNLTTLSQVQIEQEFEICRVFLDGLGITRASKHIVYPGGLYNNTVLDAMHSWNAKTGRITSYIPGNSYYSGWPYQIHSYSVHNEDKFENVKELIELAKFRGALVLYFHELTDSEPSSTYQWPTSRFIELLDYLESHNIQTLTIDEYFKLYSQSIKVTHK